MFLTLYANCGARGFEDRGEGEIVVTKLPGLFMTSMVPDYLNLDTIFRELLTDGYDIPKPDAMLRRHPKFWNNAPALKYLCHVAILKNRDMLRHFKEQLPTSLATSVENFIKIKDWESL